MSPFFILIYVYIFFVISIYAEPITNSSGQYFLSLIQNDEIDCTHPIFCYIHCKDGYPTCHGLKITTHSSNVFIDCYDCQHLEVFSDANNFIMIYNSSSYGKLHLENASNINMHYADIDNSILYAQYANNVMVLLTTDDNSYFNDNQQNIFYLDYVSNKINFECDSKNTKGYCSRYVTISASNANYFKLSINNNAKSNDFYLSVIYCPYHDNNVCIFDVPSIKQIDDVQIFVEDITLSEVSPLYFYFEQNMSTNSSSLLDGDESVTIWCEKNEINPIYEDKTEIYYNLTSERIECRNMTSKCCYLTNHTEDVDNSNNHDIDDLNHCPSSNAHDTINYCHDGNDCEFKLNYSEQTIIICANNANSLSILCKNCSSVNIFAVNASTVNINCIDNCADIHFNGMFVDEFNLECNTDSYQPGVSVSYWYWNSNLCKNLIIDVSNADTVHITADYMEDTDIYAMNANDVSLVCVVCNSLDIAIPSKINEPVTSIVCKQRCYSFDFYSHSGWKDIESVTICDLDQNSYIYWKFYCPSPIYKYAALPFQYKSISPLKTVFIACDEIKYHSAISNWDVSAQIIYDPFSNTCRGDNVEFISEFSNVICITSSLIITFWMIIFGKRMFLKLRDPIKYNKLINIEPPSKKMLLYLYLSDLFIWMSQIYILIFSWLFYNYLQTHCDRINSDNQYSDDEIVCLMKPLCSWKGFECIQTTNMSIYIYVLGITICFGLSVLSAWCCGGGSNSYQIVGASTHFICIGFRSDYKEWKVVMNDYYLKRKFFKYKQVMVALSFIVIVRYLLFFMFVSVMYFSYNEDGFNIKWYDILSILLVLCLNEIIKKQYKMLAPYDEVKHIEYILQEIYGKHLAAVICMFLGDDRKANDSNEGNKKCITENVSLL